MNESVKACYAWLVYLGSCAMFVNTVGVLIKEEASKIRRFDNGTFCKTEAGSGNRVVAPRHGGRESSNRLEKPRNYIINV